MPNLKAKTTSPRDRLYAELVSVAEAGLQRYYEEFPERQNDDRAHEASNWSLRGVKRMLSILDKYDIQDMHMSDTNTNTNT